jgi:hypothetical protein
MDTKQASGFRNTVPNGVFGNISKAVGTATFEADGAGTVVHTIKLEAGSKVFGLKAHHDNLGAGTTVKVGYAYVDANDGAAVDDAFCDGATTAPGVLEYAGKPIMIDAPAILTVTNTGTATGDVMIIPEYEFQGV